MKPSASKASASTPSGSTSSLLAIALLLALGGALFARLAGAPAGQVELAGYATSLRHRTVNQRHNARLAAQRLDGKVVPPRGVFSFNQAVESWSIDQGYVKAPVSFD